MVILKFYNKTLKGKLMLNFRWPKTNVSILVMSSKLIGVTMKGRMPSDLTPSQTRR